MSLSVTEQKLAKLVSYQTTIPKEYKEKENEAFNIFKNTLNAHLSSPRGASTLALVFGDPSQFNEKDVAMGLTASCPMSLRFEIIAQHNYRAHENRNHLSKIPPNEDSIRITNLMAATLGFALTLTGRVLRTALRTLFLPITSLHALHQEYRYEFEEWAEEDVRRIGWEWIDTGVTLLTFFIGIINTFHPNAIKLDSLRDYYITRHDEAIEKNQQFASKKRDYLVRLEKIKEEVKRTENKFAEAI